MNAISYISRTGLHKKVIMFLMDIRCDDDYDDTRTLILMLQTFEMRSKHMHLLIITFI